MPMTSHADVLELMTTRVPPHQHFAPTWRPRGVFGSFARDEQTSESDVDLLIEPDAHATFSRWLDSKWRWKRCWAARLTLITFNALETSAHLRLREHILHDLEML